MQKFVGIVLAVTFMAIVGYSFFFGDTNSSKEVTETYQEEMANQADSFIADIQALRNE